MLQVLTNAGQANAATGDQGYEDAVNCATITAASLGVTPDDVLLMSTGKRLLLFSHLLLVLMLSTASYSNMYAYVECGQQVLTCHPVMRLHKFVHQVLLHTPDDTVWHIFTCVGAA